MAEYIEREVNCRNCYHKEACDAWVRHGKILYDDYSYSTECCKNYVPATDVDKVVRCKDCKNYIPYTEDDMKDGHTIKGTDGLCLLRMDANAENLFVAVSNNDFCSYGAKMDGNKKKEG